MNEFLNNISIDTMDFSDIDGVEIVENLCFSIPWSKEAFLDELGNSRAIYLVAKSGVRVIGYAGMWKVFDEGQIMNIAVHPDFRNMHVGSGLLKGIIKIAKNDGIERITLEVRRSNLIAQSFYKKYGFVEEGFRKAYYADTGEDAIIMWKLDV